MSALADNWLTRIRAVLAAERMAIRTLDAKTVEEAAQVKADLLAELTGTKTTDEDKKALHEALAQVREELKRNLVLLAHARDTVREAINRAQPKGTSPGARLSIQL